MYCWGKADELLSADPFSAIVKALAQLLGGLEDSDKLRLKRRILDAVGSEGKVLTNLLPELEDLIGEQPTPQTTASTLSLNRFTYLFQALLKANCSEKKPLIMYLDDLQWTDESSLELIRNLLSDIELRNLLLVGSYRDNEVDESHPLSTTLATLQRDGIPYTSISLDDLSRDEVCTFLEDTLRTDEVSELVDHLYSKTHGNIFYIRACLLQLEQKQILKYSLASCSWEWISSRLEEIKVSDNVVDVVLDNMHGTRADIQSALIVAAHLRSSFSLSRFCMI